MLSILFGLGSALSWGAGDFTGGIAARKTGAYRTVFYGEVIGIFVLFFVITIFGESFPNNRTWFFAILAGALGTVGLILLYHSMTLGLMSIAAPVSALLAAALPVVVGMFREGFPEWTTFIGFGFAFFAVWMISQGQGGIKDIISHLSDLKLPLLAGIGFGLYFVLMHEATNTGATIWPMVASRLGGLVMVTTYMLITRSAWKVEDSWLADHDSHGIFYFLECFVILASQTGRCMLPPF